MSNRALLSRGEKIAAAIFFPIASVVALVIVGAIMGHNDWQKAVEQDRAAAWNVCQVAKPKDAMTCFREWETMRAMREKLYFNTGKWRD